MITPTPVSNTFFPSSCTSTIIMNHLQTRPGHRCRYISGPFIPPLLNSSPQKSYYGTRSALITYPFPLPESYNPPRITRSTHSGNSIHTDIHGSLRFTLCAHTNKTKPTMSAIPLQLNGPTYIPPPPSLPSPRGFTILSLSNTTSNHLSNQVTR